MLTDSKSRNKNDVKEVKALVSVLQDECLSLNVHLSYQPISKTLYLGLSDPSLQIIMGDAYPTSLVNKFAIFLVQFGHDYRAYQRFDFGRERLPKKSGGIEGNSNYHPRLEIAEIAEIFAKKIGFSIKHYKIRKKYCWSLAEREEAFSSLRSLEQALLINTLQYIEHGTRHLRLDN